MEEINGDLNNILNMITSFSEAISIAVFRYDLHTWFHHEDTSKYITPLCTYYGMSIEDTKIVNVAAMVHDVGKLSVLDTLLKVRHDILLPSSEEMSIIRQHSVYGHLMLSTFLKKSNLQSKAVVSILNATLHHHERWDGKGYPNGLSHYAIPFISRLVGIADAVSAMAMPERSWRSPLSSDEIVDELKKGVGNQFDPEMATTMIDIFEHGKIKHTMGERNLR